MNRRTFMRIVAGAAAIPAIGLPKPVEAAPINLIQEWIDEHPEEFKNVQNHYRYIYYYDKPIHYDPTWPEAGYVAWSHVHCSTVKPTALESASFPRERREGTASPVKQSEGILHTLW